MKKELTNIATFTDPELEKRQMELLKDGLVEEVEDIQSKLKSTWPNLVFGKLCAVLGEIHVLGGVPKLIHAVYDALGSTEPADTSSPLAYAAYARKELLH